MTLVSTTNASSQLPDVPYDVTSNITFYSYRFKDHQVLSDPERNVPCHAYFGKLVDKETLSRPEAIEHPVYRKFFDVNGHFKQRSVLRPN